MSGKKPLGFGPELRVRRKAEYARAFEGGITVRDRLLKLVVLPNGGTTTRLGTAVTRRVGGSVRRNRVRRRLREVFRALRPRLPPGLDLIAIPLATTPEPTLAALEQSFAALVRRAVPRLGVRPEPAPAPEDAGAGPGAPGAAQGLQGPERTDGT